jgi:hypothetical protein
MDWQMRVALSVVVVVLVGIVVVPAAIDFWATFPRKPKWHWVEIGCDDDVTHNVLIQSQTNGDAYNIARYFASANRHIFVSEHPQVRVRGSYRYYRFAEWRMRKFHAAGTECMLPGIIVK